MKGSWSSGDDFRPLTDVGTDDDDDEGVVDTTFIVVDVDDVVSAADEFDDNEDDDVVFSPLLHNPITLLGPCRLEWADAWKLRRTFFRCGV